jgi:hypothetical protein
VLVLKKFSNGVKFKNSFKKVLKIKKILSVQAGSKIERGAGRSFPLADPRWHADMYSHEAKTGKSVTLKRLLGQIFNCHYKRGN